MGQCLHPENITISKNAPKSSATKTRYHSLFSWQQSIKNQKIFGEIFGASWLFSVFYPPCWQESSSCLDFLIFGLLKIFSDHFHIRDQSLAQLASGQHCLSKVVYVLTTGHVFHSNLHYNAKSMSEWWVSLSHFSTHEPVKLK